MHASIQSAKRDRVLFAHSYWDIVPAALGVMHLAFIVAMFFLFPDVPLGMMLVLGVIYSFSISWNINGISHNFIHNPYFKSQALNRLFSVIESLDCGFSQVFYDRVHRQHHIGNSDHKDPKGDTIDWLSIYRYSHDDHMPENVWSYVFLGYFRDDIGLTYREIKRLSPADAKWGIFEICCTVSAAVVMGILNWKFLIFFLPFYYLGHCLSQLNGYYKHFGGNPEEPIAWGVSSYGKIYNWIWFNNGYHAEHHYRPRVHWTRMKALHEEIQEEQERLGVRVIKPPHALGFLDPDLSWEPLVQPAKIKPATIAADAKQEAAKI